MLINDIAKTQDNTIQLPYKFRPRAYQEELLRAMVPELYPPPPPTQLEEMLGITPTRPTHARNAVAVWHRRAGKDKTCINILACRAMLDVPGYYLYMAPEQAQVRKIIWQGIGGDGQRFIDHIPKELVVTKREQEMYLELVNGSIIQLAGADNYDSLVGTNPKGIIFSEYSLQNPAAYDYFRPMLLENDGWAVFIYTARGHNHAYNMHLTAKKLVEEGNPRWFHTFKTIRETQREDGSPVVTPEQYLEEVESGMPEATARQEFLCDFDSGMPGAYYADQMAALAHQDPPGIRPTPWNPKQPVITAWDLGLNDATAIWFAQVGPNGNPVLIDYIEEANVPLTEWVRRIKNKPYTYLDHVGPHDLANRDHMTGFTRLEQCAELGLHFTVVQRTAILDGIEAVRSLLPTCVFDEKQCFEGIEALKAYERVYDEKLRNFRDRPLHNWASHGADAFRYLAVAWDAYAESNGPVKTHHVITTTGRKHVKRSGSLPLLTGNIMRVTKYESRRN